MDTELIEDKDKAAVLVLILFVFLVLALPLSQFCLYLWWYLKFLRVVANYFVAAAW